MDADAAGMTDPDTTTDVETGVVGSEFAEVAVEIDTHGNGPRLRLEDRRTGRVRHLDALELEAIVWLPAGHLHQLLDPSADRWRETT